MRYTTSNLLLSLLAVTAIILSLAAKANACLCRRVHPDYNPTLTEEVVDDAGRLEGRAVDGGFCIRGWNKRRFEGSHVDWCGSTRFYDFPCTNFDSDLLTNHLSSAKATKSPSGGVWLWPAKNCKESGSKHAKWVDFDGWRDLYPDPAYYSMSWSKPVYQPPLCPRPC